ncbi:MAG TPA: hypothetical protein VK504_13070, partial [Vicinamibacterales bacterium]|nr:hypothetical protein [Vicinamibacterales bacterium]
MIPISIKQILALAPAALPAYREAFALADSVLQPYGINATPLRLAHFMAQALHESGALTVLTESVNYGADRLIPIFGRSRITDEQAQKYGRTSGHPADQEALAKILYGGVWGLKNLGNREPGDGWHFRGAGLLQLTGRGSRERIGERLGVDLVGQPWLALAPR